MPVTELDPRAHLLLENKSSRKLFERFLEGVGSEYGEWGLFCLEVSLPEIVYHKQVVSKGWMEAQNLSATFSVFKVCSKYISSILTSPKNTDHNN